MVVVIQSNGLPAGRAVTVSSPCQRQPRLPSYQRARTKLGPVQLWWAVSSYLHIGSVPSQAVLCRHKGFAVSTPHHCINPNCHPKAQWDKFPGHSHSRCPQQPESPSTALEPVCKQSRGAGAGGSIPNPPQTLRKPWLTTSHTQMLPAGRENRNILPGLGRESTAPHAINPLRVSASREGAGSSPASHPPLLWPLIRSVCGLKPPLNFL